MLVFVRALSRPLDVSFGIVFSFQSRRWKSNEWRRKQDHYAKQAKEEGLRSRASFKLKQMNDRVRLFSPGIFFDTCNMKSDHLECDDSSALLMKAMKEGVDDTTACTQGCALSILAQHPVVGHWLRYRQSVVIRLRRGCCLLTQYILQHLPNPASKWCRSQSSTGAKSEAGPHPAGLCDARARSRGARRGAAGW